MNHLRPLNEISDVSSVAKDFVEHLSGGDNEDVEAEFKGITARYGTDIEESIANLEKAKAKYSLGQYEQFIVSSGQRAVGLCLITNQLEIPPGIDESWPNISGFIFNAYRGKGLGRFSIEERMKVVERDFGNHAWTFVRDGNDPSEHLVTSVGFEKTDQAVEGWAGHHLFIYDGNR